MANGKESEIQVVRDTDGNVLATAKKEVVTFTLSHPDEEDSKVEVSLHRRAKEKGMRRNMEAYKTSDYYIGVGGTQLHFGGAMLRLLVETYKIHKSEIDLHIFKSQKIGNELLRRQFSPLIIDEGQLSNFMSTFDKTDEDIQKCVSSISDILETPQDIADMFETPEKALIMPSLIATVMYYGINEAHLKRLQLKNFWYTTTGDVSAHEMYLLIQREIIEELEMYNKLFKTNN